MLELERIRKLLENIYQLCVAMFYNVDFPSGSVTYLFEEVFQSIERFKKERRTVYLTDDVVSGLYPDLFPAESTVIVPSGEQHKTMVQVERIITRLQQLNVDRSCLLIAVGGGVITDMAGFVASIYMRGLPFGFVPSTFLAMVDASIGGKNGVNFGLFKNMIGVIRQPEFILFDPLFLKTLSQREWSNGFAEAIKYGCIFDEALFTKLSNHHLSEYHHNLPLASSIIRSCVDWKNRTVLADEQERGMRKLLNFGHTAGHALESVCLLPHGFAVSIGMLIACKISERVTGLSAQVTDRVQQILVHYQLPIQNDFQVSEVMRVLMGDKKRTGNHLDFIVLEKLGQGSVVSLDFELIRQVLIDFKNASHY